MAAMTTTEDVRSRLAVGDVEGAYATAEAIGVDTLGELAAELFDAVQDRTRWDDAKLGSRALRAALERMLHENLIDGDTITSMLSRVLLLDPDDDQALFEYLREVADSSYRYTDRSLLTVADVASTVERARRLALLDVIAEYMVVMPYLPQAPYVAAMQRAVAGAIAWDGDVDSFREAHAWFTRRLPHSQVPADIFARYTPARR
jgi:hypothetical protein